MVITWPWTVCSTLVKIYLYTCTPPVQERRKIHDVKEITMFFFFFVLFCCLLWLCAFFSPGHFFSFSDVWIQDFHQIRQWKVRVALGTVSVSARRGSRILLQHRVSQFLFFPAEGLWKDQTWLMRWIWLPLLAPHHQLKYLCNQTNLNVKQVRSLSSHSCSHTSFVPPFL